MKIFSLTPFVFLFIFLGCKKDHSETTPVTFLKTKWKLISIQDTKTNITTYYPADATRKISIVFTDSLNVISFAGVCNGGGGTYVYSADTASLHISSINTTQVYCKYVDWETYTTYNLTDAYGYKITGNDLKIYSKGTYHLFFRQDEN